MSKYETYKDLLNDLKQDKEWSTIEQYTDIAAKILMLRNERGLSQKDLAYMSGVPTKTIEKFLEDCKDIKLTDLIKIANVFNYKVTISKSKDDENICENCEFWHRAIMGNQKMDFGICDEHNDDDDFYEDDTCQHFKQKRNNMEWISVEDKLPINEKPVLAYYGFLKNGDLGEQRFMGTLSYFVFDEKPHFQHESMGLRVTHWMPLPEAPKEK